MIVEHDASFGGMAAARTSRTKIDWILQRVKQERLRELVLDRCLFADDDLAEEQAPTITTSTSASHSAGEEPVSPTSTRATSPDNDGTAPQDDEAVASIQLLLESLNVNTSIESLVMSIDFDDGSSESSTTIPCAASAMREVAFSLPSLVELHLYDEAATPSRVAAALSDLHRRGAPLRVVTLTRVALESDADVRQVAQALALHGSSLAQVRLMDLGIRQPLSENKRPSRRDAPEEPPLSSLDHLFEALAELPHLETLDVTGAVTESMPRRVRVQDRSLVRLFQNPHLQDVSLWHLGLDEQHVRCLAPVLQSHPSLTFLSLRGNPKLDWDALERGVLRWNSTLLHLYGDLLSDTVVTSRLSLWLDLNRRGRGRAWLVEKEWCPFVAGLAARADRDAGATAHLYAFLRSDPSPLLRAATARRREH